MFEAVTTDIVRPAEDALDSGCDLVTGQRH